MSEQQQSEQVTPSAEPQPTQQPAPVVPEQPGTEPTPPVAGGNGEQVAPGYVPSDETTDAGTGAGDQPEPGEVEQVTDVTEPAPPENPHADDDEPGSAGLGVTGKFVHDEPPADDAGADQ